MKIDSNEFRVQHDENGAKGGDPDIRQGRHRSIVGLERHLRSDGTRSIEFFSHLSKEEPRKCFIERIDDPAKNRRFSAADIQERKFRPAYMTACRPCLSATSSSDSPWYGYPHARRSRKGSPAFVQSVPRGSPRGTASGRPRSGGLHGGCRGADAARHQGSHRRSDRGYWNSSGTGVPSFQRCGVRWRA